MGGVAISKLSTPTTTTWNYSSSPSPRPARAQGRAHSSGIRTSVYARNRSRLAATASPFLVDKPFPAQSSLPSPSPAARPLPAPNVQFLLDPYRRIPRPR